jgi:hypothetical protein
MVFVCIFLTARKSARRQQKAAAKRCIIAPFQLGDVAVPKNSPRAAQVLEKSK